MSKEKFNVMKDVKMKRLFYCRTNWKNEVMEDFKKRWNG